VQLPELSLLQDAPEVQPDWLTLQRSLLRSTFTAMLSWVLLKGSVTSIAFYSLLGFKRPILRPEKASEPANVLRLGQGRRVEWLSLLKSLISF
jgi:hypothetical protein